MQSSIPIFLQWLDFIDAVVVLLAIVANCMVLYAVSQSDLSLPGHRRFLISLSAGDLYMCFVNVLTLCYIFGTTYGQENSQLSKTLLSSCSANLLRTLKLAGFLTNLLNLCGMSLDHMIGIVSLNSELNFKNKIFIFFSSIL